MIYEKMNMIKGEFGRLTTIVPLTKNNKIKDEKY